MVSYMKIKCEFCGKEYSPKGIGTHIWRTHGDGKDHKPIVRGPTGRIPWNKGLTKDDPRIKETSEKISLTMKGRPGKSPSKEIKQQVSESMKKAHAEGRAWNIGKSRWNNEPSYPEKFFMTVIENEFNDKNYVREFPFGNFSLDFAWVDKKHCIEIDGDQHQRFLEYQERDQRKDEALIQSGWKVLRISWREMFKNPKYWIQIAKDFIPQ